jgi:general secretion pathway protein D
VGLVAGNAPQLTWVVPPEVKVGDTFEVALHLKSGVPLRGGPFQISYPKDKLTAVDVGEGSYFSQNGSTTSFTQAIEVDAGRIKAGIIRHRDEGTPGKGSVLVIKFKALKAGIAPVTLTGFDAIGLTEAQRPTLPITAQVEVK